MSKNKQKSLSWDAFQSLGNPENGVLPEENVQEGKDENYNHTYDVRVWLDKKHRGGKTASVIKGIEATDEELKALCKELKTKCGVGGSSKNGEIIIQGDQRQKILKHLLAKGYTKTKLAGG